MYNNKISLKIGPKNVNSIDKYLENTYTIDACNGNIFSSPTFSHFKKNHEKTSLKKTNFGFFFFLIIFYIVTSHVSL